MTGGDVGTPCGSVLMTTLGSDTSGSLRCGDSSRATRNCDTTPHTHSGQCESLQHSNRKTVEMLLNQADIKNLCVEKRRKNDKALSLLTLVVSDTYFDDIGRCELASELWEILEGIYTNYGLLHMIIILKEMVNTTKTDDFTMQENVSKIQNLNRKLIKKKGLHFTDKLLAMFFLMGLPLEKYDGLVRGMEKDGDNLTPAVVKAKLLLEEKRIKRDEDQKVNMEGAKALAVKQQLLNRYPNFDTKRKFDYKPRDQRNILCFACNEPRHIARFCTKVARQDNATKTEDQKQGPGYGEQGRQLGNAQTNCWLLDTAASHHMTPNRDIMRNFNANVHGEVEVTNGQMAKIKGVGTVTKLKDKHGGWSIELSDVFYGPDLCNNLISGKLLDAKGMEIRIIHGCVTVLDDNVEIFKALSGIECNVYIVECET
ncbi:hypothetical protein PR048_014393 [Dryococelus australis]|uniref:Retrovirus-related Pol polyprotein from transposon TNT 1-94-like beta-barrel domain-containing protein n=1 Tax=Dryococelus australis TaxID=614101 RepID=A0ABQ9HE39_9NEOP|nr:hypothetical protein PR048_014393 [Dryococelus australis]